MRENKAAVQSMNSACISVIQRAVSHLNILGLEVGNTEIIIAVTDQLVKLRAEELHQRPGAASLANGGRRV